MKKALALLSASAMLSITLCACGERTVQTSNKNAESKVSNNLIASNDLSSGEEFNFKELSYGETESTDFVEITIDKIGIAQEIKPTDTSSVYSYLSDKDGEQYIYLTGSMKNTGTESYGIENIKSDIILDGNYKYVAFLKADNGGNDFYNDTLKPFGKDKFYIVASVPDELIEKFESVEVRFGFDDNFKTRFYNSYADCTHLYKVTAANK